MTTPLERIDILGNPNIGVFAFVNNKIALTPPRITRSTKKAIEEILGVEIIETTIAGTVIIGVFIAGNDSTILVPHIIHSDELEQLKSELKGKIEIKVLNTKNTALGNLIVANNKAALASVEFDNKEIKMIEDSLGIKVYRKELAGIPAIGALVVANDNAGLVHPSLSDEEIEDLEKKLNINAGPATINEGVGFIKSGVLLNNNGILVGNNTTGPEIMNIQAILG